MACRSQINKSLIELSFEEGLALIRTLRQIRREQAAPRPKKVSTKKSSPSKGKSKKLTKSEKILSAAEGMSKEDLLKMINQLKEKGNN